MIDKGDLDVAGGRFESYQGAFIGGNLSVGTNDTTQANVEPGTVQGTVKIKLEERHARQEVLGLGAAAFWFRLVLGFTLFVTALALSFLLPGHLSAAGPARARSGGWWQSSPRRSWPSFFSLP